MKIIKDEAVKLWNNGLFDAEIAEHLNCSEVAIRKWRKRNYLESNLAIARGKKSSVIHGQITILWESGLKDSEIAKELKCSIMTVWKFRKENGMESNVGLFD